MVGLLSAINPFGPILDKELRSAARRKRTYVLRVIYLGALLLCLLLAYSAAGAFRGFYGAGVAQQQMYQSQLATMFFGFFTMFVVTAMAVIAPVLTSTAISSERLHRTLPVLLMTPITSWQIIFGKLISRLWIALTLLGLSLPVLALVRLLGSVELEQMFAVLCLAVVTALVMASVGLFYSTLLNRAYAVILLAYASGLGFYLIFPMILSLFLTATRSSSPPMIWLHILAACNPFATAMLVVQGSTPLGISWIPCVLVQLGLTAVFVTFSALAVRRYARRAGEKSVAEVPAPLPTPSSNEENGAQAFPTGIVHPIRKVRSVGDNPVLWRETRRPLMARRWQSVTALVVIAGVMGLMYLALGYNNALDDKGTQIVFAILFCAVMTLLTCVLSATAIAQEKESDTWTVLLAAPLSAGQIVWGKVLGLMRRMLAPSLLITLHFALFTIGEVLPFSVFLMTLWIILAYNTIWLATGVYLSLRLNKVTFAVIFNLLLPVLLYGAFPAIVLVLAELGEFSPRRWDEIGLWPMPFYYLGAMISSVHRGGGISNLQLPCLGTVNDVEFFLIAFAIGGLTILLAMGVIALTIRSFDQMVGRAPQRSTSAHPHRALA